MWRTTHIRVVVAGWRNFIVIAYILKLVVVATGLGARQRAAGRGLSSGFEALGVIELCSVRLCSALAAAVASVPVIHLWGLPTSCGLIQRVAVQPVEVHRM